METSQSACSGPVLAWADWFSFLFVQDGCCSVVTMYWTGGSSQYHVNLWWGLLQFGGEWHWICKFLYFLVGANFIPNVIDFFQAMKAHLNALAQLHIVLNSSADIDPFSRHKCYLFIAQAQMQAGFLRESRDIIRQVYKMNQSLNEDGSNKLVRMCLGLWSRLRKFYIDRKEMQSRQTSPCVMNSGWLYEVMPQSNEPYECL